MNIKALFSLFSFLIIMAVPAQKQEFRAPDYFLI